MSAEWKQVRLDELTEAGSPITYGVVKPGDTGDVLFIRGGDLLGGRVLDGQLRTITRAVSEQYRRTLLRGGELLICLVGQPGQVAVAPPALSGANIARQVGLIRLRSEINSEFISYFLQSPDGQANLGTYTGGSVQQVINLSDLRTVNVPVPPLAEQQRIVGILDEAFAGLATAKAKAEKNLQNSRALFESHLQSVFTQRGNGWVEKRLEQIGKTQTGSTPKTSDQANYGEFISFVKPADFNADGSLDYERDGLSEKGLASARIVPEGSVLMVCIGATIGKCGYCDHDVTTNQQINALTPTDGSSHRFLYYQMLTEGFQRSVIHRSGQATLPIINKSNWSALPVWLPPTVAEQKRIAAKFDALVAETQRLARLYERKLAALEALKKSLLHQAFTGKL